MSSISCAFTQSNNQGDQIHNHQSDQLHDHQSDHIPNQGNLKAPPPPPRHPAHYEAGPTSQRNLCCRLPPVT